MTEASVPVTESIMKAQFELAQTLYDFLESHEWVKASLLITTNERGHVSGVVEVVSADGTVEVVDTPNTLHLPIISVRLAMRLPDTNETFTSLVVSIDDDGNTELNATYDREIQPVWKMPTTPGK